MKNQLNNNYEFIFIRKVLIEKIYMKLRSEWAKSQKENAVRNQNYEMAATFREIERFYIIPEYFHENDEERISKMYCELFEKYHE